MLIGRDPLHSSNRINKIIPSTIQKSVKQSLHVRPCSPKTLHFFATPFWAVFSRSPPPSACQIMPAQRIAVGRPRADRAASAEDDGSGGEFTARPMRRCSKLRSWTSDGRSHPSFPFRKFDLTFCGMGDGFFGRTPQGGRFASLCMWSLRIEKALKGFGRIR